MRTVGFVLIIFALAAGQVLIGGARLLYSIPVVALFAVAALLILWPERRSGKTARAGCVLAALAMAATIFARIEWSLAECAVAAALPPLSATALARFAAQDFEHLVFGLQPALRLHSSAYPVFTVWLANQAENAPPVDQSLGSECGMVLARSDHTEVRHINERMFSFLSALQVGLALGDAMSRANLEVEALTGALEFVFAEGLVSSLTVNEAPATK